ncbi:MAG TPA: hypothetical protein VJK48_06070 [Chlamydiales bacterium]|nr:MAG: hypothetical protein A3F67_07810 [Verrucomicrobia bacterium RIFCSPHIGHO2_12_FULL_41_10]HLB53251.1 hypothetical protein [Chlamydiales bacterium]
MACKVSEIIEPLKILDLSEGSRLLPDGVKKPCCSRGKTSALEAFASTDSLFSMCGNESDGARTPVTSVADETEESDPSGSSKKAKTSALSSRITSPRSSGSGTKTPGTTLESVTPSTTGKRSSTALTEQSELPTSTKATPGFRRYVKSRQMLPKGVDRPEYLALLPILARLESEMQVVNTLTFEGEPEESYEADYTYPSLSPMLVEEEEPADVDCDVPMIVEGSLRGTSSVDLEVAEAMAGLSLIGNEMELDPVL